MTDVVDLAGDKTSGHPWGQSRAVEVPSDRVFDDGDSPARIARVGRGDVDQRRVAADRVELHAEPVGRHPAYREVAADRVALDRPGNVTASSDQRDVPLDRQFAGPGATAPLIRTVFASMAVTFPLTVMVVCPAGSDGARHSRHRANSICRLAAQAEE